MADALWAKVDGYFEQTLLSEDSILEQAQLRAEEAGLPAIAVSATQGKQLMLLARAMRARRVLEVGTLGGYSAIWLARGLPTDGHIDTCEIDPVHARVAEENLAAAGFGAVVEVHLGPAADTLERLRAAGEPYDLVFIDADKQNNLAYLRAALDMSREGSVIVVDNVVRDGAVADASSRDASVLGTRALFDFVAAEPRLDATAIQTVGNKGYDGFALILVIA